jgi:hypothetical protein
MPFTTTTTCSCDIIDANQSRSSFDWHSFLSLPQEQHHMSTLNDALSRRSLPFSPNFTLNGENDQHLFQNRSATTSIYHLDRVIAILDAALEIVGESDVGSSVVDDPSFNHTGRNFGHSTSINDGLTRGRKTSQGD